MSLFGHKIKQTLVTVHDIINYISVTDCVEMFSRTMYLGFLNGPELHGGHRAFRFGNEINVLDGAFIEGNRPVRIIVSYWRCDIEAVRQLHINRNICVGVQISRKIALVCGIIYDMII